MQGQLLRLVGNIDEASQSYRAMRRFGLPLIHDTCAISPNDCEFWEQCRGEQDETEPCTPEGLAFRLADIVLRTLALMQELGLDCDKVITAEFRYLTALVGWQQIGEE